jgi:hypothetical protein
MKIYSENPLKIQTMFCHSWHLNEPFEYKVSKILLGAPYSGV